MPWRRICTWTFALLSVYVLLSMVTGVLVADGALHPLRRPLSTDARINARAVAHRFGASLTDVSITVSDGVSLSAWFLRPAQANDHAVILLHGLSDNREGMIGYAELFLSQGYAILMPDARAHGQSGGQVATYGLLERIDIHNWAAWLEQNQHPHCIFGFAESMGAAQLLQALDHESRFCAVAAESPFSNLEEIAYDRNSGPAFPRRSLVGANSLAPSYYECTLESTVKVRNGNERGLPPKMLSPARRRQSC